MKLKSRIIILVFSGIAVGIIIYLFYKSTGYLKDHIDIRQLYIGDGSFSNYYTDNIKYYTEYIVFDILSFLLYTITIALLVLVNIRIWRKSVLNKENQEIIAKRKRERLEAKKEKLEKKIDKIE